MRPQTPMIDVSANNHPDGGPIDWRRVKAAGYGAVMIKATEGSGYVNPWLQRDASDALAAGLLVGFYHFAHPGEDLPILEATHALAAIGGLRHDLGLALDLEVTEGKTWPQLASFAKAFHATVRERLNHSPLYVNDNFLDNLPGAPWGERLWVAQTSRPRFVCWAWQEVIPDRVDGITGDVDVGYLAPTV